ncbi:unnamed protein product [Darwinula stevensoni]|uniref:DNA topoisomerase I n=1 Tax=Darwinula stevensoni TaxID=69355 RepID=A0A7R9FQ51_9CRUS|nr:unnamed protein product [Darwinula stevensoni]CAG0899093.1 unnamed protein product [Darwinula stevensoni]
MSTVLTNGLEGVSSQEGMHSAITLDRLERSSHLDRENNKTSSHPDRSEHKDGEKPRDREKTKDKEKHREHKKKHKEKHKEKGKDREKHKEKSKHKDKHRDKERKEGKNKNKEKHREKEKYQSTESEEDGAISFDDAHENSTVKIETIDTSTTKEEVPIYSRSEPESSEDESALYIDRSLEIKDETLSDDEPSTPPPNKRKKKTESDDDWEQEDEDNDYHPSKKARKSGSTGKKRKKKLEEESDDDFKGKTKATKKAKVKREEVKQETPQSPSKKRKKEEEEQEVWKWWEEEKRDDGVKWKFLQHKGPVFAPDYEPLPDNVRFYYDKKPMKLSLPTEEVATFYAKMLTHDYTTKDIFNKNFMTDWRKVMTDKEREIITDLRRCDFKEMNDYFTQKSEERKSMSKEEKQNLKEQNEAIVKEYGFCLIDGHQERIGNFRIEPPGLFRGRGEHPKQGKLKARIMPEDVIINCSKDSKIPQPPPGHKWKEVRHDPSVTWLASWTENIQGQIKYVMLNPSSKLKAEKDWQKYETARRLHKGIDKIRRDYWNDMKSKEMRIRQRAVAMYLIDKLALRAGNEKEEGETADTVGCCSLRFEHITLAEERDGKKYVVTFDFLGKDSIRYLNEVSVEKRVFKNLQLFMEDKQEGDDLFDRLNTAILNKHLNSLMEGLTAKVFRTYNASRTLQEQLDQLTDPNDSVTNKILAYNRANRAVAILCNHQRSAPKSHAKSMENLANKIQAKKEAVKEAEKELKNAKKAYKDSRAQKDKVVLDKKEKALERLKEQLHKLNVQAMDKEEGKEIALGTSKLNYLDPRISVAWCKKHNVPIEKVYNKTQRQKFRWAIDMAGPDFHF